MEVSTQWVLYRFLGLVSTRFGHRVRTVRGFSTVGNDALVGHFPPRWGERICGDGEKVEDQSRQGDRLALTTPCVKCGYSIPPQEILRVEFDQVELPEVQRAVCPRPLRDNVTRGGVGGFAICGGEVLPPLAEGVPSSGAPMGLRREERSGRTGRVGF
jgi:hypothetical protein